MTKYFDTIEIDYGRDDLLSEQARVLLREFYMLKTEKSPQEAFARASVAYCKGDYELAQRIYDYASLGYFMFASPVLSNAPEPDGKSTGLPISCFLSYVPDSLVGLIGHTEELRWLSVKGGGVGGHWSDVRAVSDIAPGPIPFIHTVDADMTAYKQGKTRKGSYAAYLDVSHPDIEEFIHIRVPTGDPGRKSLNLHNAVIISDAFMEAVSADAEWSLVDPKSREVRKTLKARRLWEEMLEVRFRTGEPYLCFIDNALKQFPQEQKDLGLTLHGSNLCIEIFEATSPERTAVCCLSSLNAAKFKLWRDTTIVEDLITMLDGVMDFFIDHAPDTIERAKFSAMRERSLGLGIMGMHTFLQQEFIAFETEEAIFLSEMVTKIVKDRAVEQSIELARKYGECPDFINLLSFTIRNDTEKLLKWYSRDQTYSSSEIIENGKRAFDYKVGDKIKGNEILAIRGRGPNQGRRNAHLMAIAPNANSSMITGCSPSIEPISANAFVHRTRAGSHLIKNETLEGLLASIGQNTDEVWNSIIEAKGSVQHLDFLTDEQRAVFKTADELDQHYVIRHAAARQKWVCQGQSVNVFFQAGVDRTYLNSVHFQAWKQGLKGLYYLRTEAERKVASFKASERVALKDHETVKATPTDAEDCVACQG